LTDKPELLIKHYQKTYDLTYQLWSQRNRIFLLLLAVVGVGAIFTCCLVGEALRNTG
jgi:hypothetical protein